MNTLGLHMDNLSQGMEALKRVHKILDLVEECKKDVQLLDLPRQSMSGDIRYGNVTFSYPASDPALRNVSLCFKAGSTTALVGLSGSGKTTLVKLLQRLYETDSGSIEIDGTDIAQISRNSLRQAIAMVSQDVYLFDRSVLDNIRLSRPGATEAEVIEAAHVAQAHEFIAKLPQGYYTKLGERGGTLSAGQRQRVSIARAVLKNAPIMVFDEATSNLDSNTEASIARELRRVGAGRTVILIAHRLATVRQADHIYALEDGEVIAEGTHQELVRQPGRYQALWRAQTGRA
jgi:ATP-binding cassette subfamily B protein